MNLRTCIVTRQEHNPDEMIRFVLDLEKQVVPDLKRNLPGRGVWVHMHYALVEKAVKKKLFAHGFKQKAGADDTLPELIESLLRRHALNALSITKKAGLMVPGQSKAEAAIRSGNALLLLCATDAGADGKKKLLGAVKAQEVYEKREVPVLDAFSSDEMDGATGGVNVAHIALLEGGASRKFKQIAENLLRYKS